MEGSTTLKRGLSSPDLDSASKTMILQPTSGSPLLLLAREDDFGVLVYKPDANTVYETKRDLSGYRILGSSGKWFLVVDSGMNLYIIDVFSEERIDLPPLDSLEGGLYKVERVGEKIFKNLLIEDIGCRISYYDITAEDLRGRLWVDEKNRDYLVVWQFDGHQYLGFCKKGDAHYREIHTKAGVPRVLRGLKDMVLKGSSLYLFATRDFIRHLDLSGQDNDVGYKDVSENHKHPMWMPRLSKDEDERIEQDTVLSVEEGIAVRRSNAVLFFYSYQLAGGNHRMFHLYERDPKDLNPETYDTKLVEVHSLGEEALFLDLGFTVLANPTLGIEPNSIYFTRGPRIGRHNKKLTCLDICVFDLTTKTTKRFDRLAGIKVKDAQWFIPS